MLSLSFRRLAWSNLLAQSAEQLSLAAVPIVAVLLLQAGPGEIGFLASIQSLPSATEGGMTCQCDFVSHIFLYITPRPLKKVAKTVVASAPCPPKEAVPVPRQAASPMFLLPLPQRQVPRSVLWARLVANPPWATWTKRIPRRRPF